LAKGASDGFDPALLLSDLHQSENKKITISLTLRTVVLYVFRSYAAAYACKVFFLNFRTANCATLISGVTGEKHKCA